MPFRNAASEAGRITFTRASAERIAGAVQIVENQRPAAQPLTFEPYLEKPHIFRVGVVATAWPKNSTAVVTLDRSGRTVEAYNKLVSLPTGRTVNIAKDGTAWYLVSYEVGTATAVVATSTATVSYITGISVGATLNTTSCAITVATTAQTASLTFMSGTFTAAFLRLEP